MAAPLDKCPTCDERADEITRAFAVVAALERRVAELDALREEVAGLRRLRAHCAELELEIACLRTNRSEPIQARDS